MSGTLSLSDDDVVTTRDVSRSDINLHGSPLRLPSSVAAPGGYGAAMRLPPLRWRRRALLALPLLAAVVAAGILLMSGSRRTDLEI